MNLFVLHTSLWRIILKLETANDDHLESRWRLLINEDAGPLVSESDYFLSQSDLGLDRLWPLTGTLLGPGFGPLRTVRLTLLHAIGSSFLWFGVNGLMLRFTYSPASSIFPQRQFYVDGNCITGYNVPVNRFKFALIEKPASTRSGLSYAQMYSNPQHRSKIEVLNF